MAHHALLPAGILPFHLVTVFSANGTSSYLSKAAEIAVVQQMWPMAYMGKQQSILKALGALMIVLFLGSCDRPISDNMEFGAIQAEASQLMKKYPGGWKEVAAGEWPAQVRELRPESVIVYEWGVEITIRHSFDGGWGYSIPRKGQHLPMPPACYSAPREGVFMHGPC